MAGTKAIHVCLTQLGVTIADVQGGESLIEEFASIKKVYFRRVSRP